MDGLASIADDDVFDQSPNNIIENRHAEKRQPVRPGDEDGPDHHECDPRLAIEIFLEVELIVTARRATFDDCCGRRRGDRIRLAAALTRPRRLSRFARLARVAFRAEEVDGRHC